MNRFLDSTEAQTAQHDRSMPRRESVAAILLGSSHDLRQAVDGRQRRVGELLDGLPHIVGELHLHGALPRLLRVLPALAQGLERGIELIAAGIEAHEFSPRCPGDGCAADGCAADECAAGGRALASSVTIRTYSSKAAIF